MEKPEILLYLKQVYAETQATIASHDNEKCFEPEGEKWSIAQHLQHLIMSSAPVASLYKKPKEFLAQFEELFNDEIIGKKKYIRDLSKGNQKKVGIVAALMGSPEIILLDEPFANLDPTTQIRLKNLLKKWKEENQLTMLISSHDLNHVTEVCERIVLLEKGEIKQDIATSDSTLKDLEAYFAAY